MCFTSLYVFLLWVGMPFANITLRSSLALRESESRVRAVCLTCNEYCKFIPMLSHHLTRILLGSSCAKLIRFLRREFLAHNKTRGRLLACYNNDTIEYLIKQESKRSGNVICFTSFVRGWMRVRLRHHRMVIFIWLRRLPSLIRIFLPLSAHVMRPISGSRDEETKCAIYRPRTTFSLLLFL